MRQYRLPKKHRLCSQTAIDHLFHNPTEGGGSALAYPLRAVWAPRTGAPCHPPVKFLISIPKKRLHHAVDRVLMRRRVREAYRLQRPVLVPENTDKTIDLAFIYVADKPESHTRVASAVKRLLKKIFPPESTGHSDIRNNKAPQTPRHDETL